MKKIIIINILCIANIWAFQPVYDHTSYTQMMVTYEEVKKATKEALKQTRELQKQVESLNGIRGQVSDVKRGIYGEVNFWKHSYERQKRATETLIKTVENTDKNFNSMFDLSDGKYYKGKYKNKKSPEFSKEVLAGIEESLKYQNRDIQELAMAKMDKEEKELFSIKEERITNNLSKLSSSIGSKITYDMFQAFMQDKTQENIKTRNEILSYQKTLEEEKSVYAMNHLTNRILLKMMAIIMENSDNTKKYQTAMMMKSYRLQNSESASHSMASFLEENAKINSAYATEHLRDIYMTKDRPTIMDVLNNR